MSKIIFIMQDGKQYYINTKFKHNEVIINELIQDYDLFFFDDNTVLDCRKIEAIYVDSKIYLNSNTVQLHRLKNSPTGWQYGSIVYR